MNNNSQRNLNQAPLDTTMVQYNNLVQPPQLDQNLLSQIDSNIKGLHWSYTFQCITMIRSMTKFYPQYIPDIFAKYGQLIVQFFNNGTTLLLKNIMKLLSQIFNCGDQVNLEGCVAVFLPLLLKRASNQANNIVRQLCQEVLTILSKKCCYCNTIQLVMQICCDKNSSIQTAQLSIKMLAGMLSNLGPSIMQINSNTLRIIMQGLSFLINGKRNNMKTSSLDACIFIFNQIGSQNFLQLMNYSLSNQQVNSMSQSMESHRTQKVKTPHLSDVLKQQKMQKAYQHQYMNSNNLRM